MHPPIKVLHHLLTSFFSLHLPGPTSLDRATPTSLDGNHPVSTDRHLEFGLRAYDQYGARRFKWEQKDEYGVYRYEGFNELSSSMAEMRIEIDSMKKQLEKEATPSASINANHVASIDIQPQSSREPAQAEVSAKKKDEWRSPTSTRKLTSTALSTTMWTG
ncbi:hypothetical protein Bca101_020249 [Brassica carinata]